MNLLSDSLTRLPVDTTFTDFFGFASFTLHMVFVLLAVGTAIVAISAAVSARLGRVDEGLARRMLGSGISHRTLALVLGFGPLLFLAAGNTLPFFTGASLFAPWLLGALVLITVSFTILDRIRTVHDPTSGWAILRIVIAAGLLVAVPGTFALVMTGAENPEAWASILNDNHTLSGALAVHWAFRFAHVLGASVVFSATYHLAHSAETESQRSLMIKWIVGGLLAQFFIGMLLYSFLPEVPSLATKLMLLTGISAGVWLLWVSHAARMNTGRFVNLRTIAGFMILLIAMLMARQNIQDRSFIPMRTELAETARAYRMELAPFEADAMARYRKNMRTVYFDGETIYEKACAFCHGVTGDGSGIEARNMTVPPEKIRFIRADREHLLSILKTGVPGSAMPYFSYFDRGKLDNVIDELDRRFGVLQPPEELPVAVPFDTYKEAERVYDDMCASCHGSDGTGAEVAFQPPVPDFTAGSLSPERMFEIITNGYRGTAMPGYANLDEGIRWGLIRVIYTKRSQDGEP